MKAVKSQVKVKKGDKVQILSGKDRGKTGNVLSVDTAKGRLTVEGHNLRIKHVRPQREGEKGQRLQYPAALSISNVAVVCPKCEKAARIGWQLLDGGKKKARSCRKCHETID
jgi:large subunit ribosomal protein L24